MIGTLYGVGVGPGDPELLTLKAVRIIKECDIIAIPALDKHTCVAFHIAQKAIPELDEKEILPIDMPMIKDKVLLKQSHEQGAYLITEQLQKGKNIAFLTLGDPTIYSTYIYIHRLVKESGHQTEIISGIPSFCAVAATLGDSLVDKAELLHIIPSSYSISESISLSGTKVYMKAGKQIGEVKKQLQSNGFDAVMVENCGMSNEKIYPSVEDIPEDAGYYSLIISKESK
ncbi:MAG: precorrin-2 C20-methyltransferase [Anaerocolumna sp.]|jgi:precorrin-2/cobalt-factor-2 C20-methyltransferase|nr:precorrin-2 C20-methyltransferase [Anaerocolumna sp.]